LLFSLSGIDTRLRVDRGLWKTEQREQVKKGAYEAEEGGRVEDEEREPRADHPYEAVRFRRLQMQDDKGFIPTDGMEKARQHIKLMRVAAKTDAKDAAGVKPDSWTWLGPGNIGGRIRSIVIDPANANNMWVGSVTGGIWRTSNGGAVWFPVNDFLANLAVSTLVINPTNANIMYAGTGETFLGQTGDNIQGAGVFKSTDRGVTWAQLASTTTGDWFYVNRLAISPNGNTILAATDSGIWRSTDAGVTWSQRTFNEQTYDIDFNPTDNTRAIAGGNGVARFSTDGGVTWSTATFNIPAGGRVEIAYAPSNPTIVYASVNRTTGVPPNVSNGDVYWSTNGGQNYILLNTGNNLLGGQGGYDNIVWVNPQNANFLIVAGVFPFRSTDGGITFTTMGDANTLLPHTDQHMIVAHPGFNNTTNRTVFFSGDGGIFRLDDVTTPPPATIGWTALNHNLGITQFYGAAGNPTTGVIVGGAQDNFTLRYTGNTEGWTVMFGGDGGFCAADPTDPNYFYGEYTYLQIVRSTNGGTDGSYIFTGISDAGDKTPNAQTSNFIAPFILDPNQPNTMLAGGLSLWRSTNVKAMTPNWAAIKAPTGGSSPVSAIAVSPLSSARICVGHNNGDIYRTFNGTDAAPIWTKIDTAGLPDRYVTRLTIDPNHSTNWIYATFGGFNTDNVYRTTDNGTTWANISGTGVNSLPAVPVRSLTYHPRNPNLLYVGTEIGVFTSDDAGATWEVPQDGPANVSVDELFWLGNDLIAATFGRGLYRASGGIYVDCNYNGIQLGTFDQPYKTVTAAVNAVTSYRPIWLKPCNYNEPMTITKRLELRGSGGIAAIGRP